jgi:hypothetical protein
MKRKKKSKMTQKAKKHTFMMVVNMGKNDYGNVHIFTIIDLETKTKN